MPIRRLDRSLPGPRKRTTADKQDVASCRSAGTPVAGACVPPFGGTDWQRRALDYLEQRLLHALTGNVASDRGVVPLACDLVDLVDIDDTALGIFRCRESAFCSKTDE